MTSVADMKEIATMTASKLQSPIRVSGARYMNPVGKRLEHMTDGSLGKKPLLDERSNAAEAINAEFATVAEAFEHRKEADARTMFFTGTFAPGMTDARVVASKALPDASKHFDPENAPHFLTATKDFLAFREGPGLMPIDIDSKASGDLAAVYPDAEPFRFQTQDAVSDALAEILPEANGCPLMVKPSASCMIADAATGEVLKGPGGWRAYIPIDDAREIPRILDLIHQRCWARGKFRYAFLSAGGAVLDRSLADLAMARPTQPDYPCADLGPGLKRAEDTTVVFDDDGPYLVTASVVLSDEDRESAAGNIEKARAFLAPEAKVAVAKRKREHVSALVAKRVPKDAAERSAAKRFEAGVLLGSDVIALDDGEEIDVATLLGPEGEKYDGRVCFDPVEPGYDGERPVGKIYLNDGVRPIVHSFAHGSKVFHLRHDNETATLAINAAGRGGELIARILALSDLGPVELSQREKQAAQALGLGSERRSIRESVAQFRGRMMEHAGKHDDEKASERTGPVPRGVALSISSFPHTAATEGGGVKVLDHPDNIRHLFNSYGISVRYNVIRKDSEWQHPDIHQGADNAATVLHSEVLGLCALNKVPTANLGAHMTAIAAGSEYNPVVECLSSLKWDGKPRFEALADAMEADEAAICRIVLRLFFIQACAAADNAETACERHPEYRAHFEGIMTFVGGQGVGKTKGLRKLLPPKLRPCFKEGLSLNLRDKDSIRTAVSCWVAELGELEGTFRKSDIADLKAFISKDTDEIRMPYAAAWSKFARRTVFTGTVNDVEFLADETGNRRFWPLTVDRIDVEWSDDEIEQLWAEAWSRYFTGEKWWPTEDEAELLEANAEEYRGRTALEETIEKAFDWGKPPEGARRTASDIYKMINPAATVDPDMRTLKSVGTTLGRIWRRTGLARKQKGVPHVKFEGEWFRANACSGKNRGWLLPPRKQPALAGAMATIAEMKKRSGAK
jgi:hypothetical protein